MFLNVEHLGQFNVRTTPELKPFQIAIDELINTENKILQLFLNTLIHHNVFTTPTPPIMGNIVVKRGLLDFLSPCSTSDIAYAANSNYKNINRNFREAHNAELRLSYRQNQLSKTYRTLDSTTKTIAREELFQPFHLFLIGKPHELPLC